MRITRLTSIDIPRIITQYEDQYVVEKLFQAKAEHKSKNGRDTVSYIYCFPQARWINTLPKFFVTNCDKLDYISTIKYIGQLQDFCHNHILKQWDSLEEVQNSNCEKALVLLSMLDINSKNGGFNTNIFLPDSDHIKYVFDWTNTQLQTDNKQIVITNPSAFDECYLSDHEGIFIKGDDIKILSHKFGSSVLRELILPPSLNTIERNTLSGCTALEHLCIPKKCRLFFDDFEDISVTPITINLL